MTIPYEKIPSEIREHNEAIDRNNKALHSMRSISNKGAICSIELPIDGGRLVYLSWAVLSDALVSQIDSSEATKQQLMALNEQLVKISVGLQAVEPEPAATAHTEPTPAAAFPPAFPSKGHKKGRSCGCEDCEDF